MSVMRAIKVKEICKEWFKTGINFILPASSLKPLTIELTLFVDAKQSLEQKC